MKCRSAYRTAEFSKNNFFTEYLIGVNNTVCQLLNFIRLRDKKSYTLKNSDSTSTANASLPSAFFFCLQSDIGMALLRINDFV